MKPLRVMKGATAAAIAIKQHFILNSPCVKKAEIPPVKNLFFGRAQEVHHDRNQQYHFPLKLALLALPTAVLVG